MADISVSAAVGEGFALIRRQPVAVAIWAAIILAILALRIAVFIPVYGAFASAVMQGVRSGSSAPPNMAALLPQIQQAQALGLLLSLVQLMGNAVLACAVFRAVLHPEQSRYGYLRLGGAELFLFVFYIALFIGIFVGVLVLAIPLAIVGALVGQSSSATGATFAAVAVVGVGVAIIWLALRLSMLGPMLVENGQIRLGEAWAATKGKVGALFLIGLLLVAIAFVAEVVLFGVSIATLGATFGVLNPAALAQLSPQDVAARLAPALAVFGVGLVLLLSFMTPVFNAPWARAYRDLRRTDVAATFG
jgi:hypothetical protein